MKNKLFENVGGNKFRLLVESVSPAKVELVRAGLKKVFSAGHKEISYQRLEGLGFGYIKDINTAKRCAIKESLAIAPEYGYSNNENEQKFVKEVNWHDEESYKRSHGDTFDDREMDMSDTEIDNLAKSSLAKSSLAKPSLAKSSLAKPSLAKSSLASKEEDPVQEDRYARHNPEGGDITDIEDMGVWDNPDEAMKLKVKMMAAIEAGNFDMAHQLLDKLTNYHN